MAGVDIPSIMRISLILPSIGSHDGEFTSARPTIKLAGTRKNGFGSWGGITLLFGSALVLFLQGSGGRGIVTHDFGSLLYRLIPK